MQRFFVRLMLFMAAALAAAFLAPAAQADKSPLDFSNANLGVVREPETFSITVTNRSDESFPIVAQWVSGGTATGSAVLDTWVQDGSLVNQCLRPNLAPGESCSVQFRIVPLGKERFSFRYCFEQFDPVSVSWLYHCATIRGLAKPAESSRR